MRVCSYFCTALAFLLVICTAAAEAPQSTQPAPLPVGSATLTQFKGEVTLHGPQSETLVAQTGLVLAAESTIETEKGSALLELQDGSQVLVKPHSRVVLKSPDQDKGYYLELLIGKIVNKIQKRLGSTPSFRMGTPTAVITVRGTRFEVEVNKKLRTFVSVYEGIVEVQSLGGGGQPVLVRPGFITNVERDHAAAQPREMNDSGIGSGSGSGGREGTGQGNERDTPPSSPSKGKDD